MSHVLPMAEPPLPRGPRLAISLVTVAVVGFSLTLLGWQLSMDSVLRGKFLYENALGVPLRTGLLLLLLAGAALPFLSAGFLRLKRGPRIEPGLYRFATLIAPLSLAFWLPILFDWEGAQKNTLMYLIMLSLFVLAERALLARALEEWRRSRAARPGPVNRLPLTLPGWLGLTLVLLAGLGYTVYTSYFTILNHRQVATTAFDLGIYDNLMYNAMHGRFFHSPVLFGPGDRNYIAGHAELAMVLFVPFYAIRPHAETMLIMQSVMLGMASLPLYLFARRLLSTAAALLLAVAYLLFAPLHGPHFYDFHWLPIAIFFHFWLYYAIVARKTWLVVLSVLVLFGIREDVPVGLALLGTFLFVTGLRMRLGIVLAITSSIWFVLDKFVLMPRMGAWWFENLYSELFADGRASYGAVISTLLSNPVYAVSSFVRDAKLQYGLHMVAPLAFLPLKRVAFILLMIPGAAFTLMTTAYWPTVSISFQYTTHWIPYLFLAAVLGLVAMRYEGSGVSKRRAALIVVSIAILSHSYNFGAILQRDSFKGGFSRISFEMNREAVERYEGLMSLIKMIPQSASVAATEAVNPHISARLDAYAFRYDFGPVDYMLFSSREIAGDSRNVLIEQLTKVPYRLVKKVGEFYLFRRGSGNGATDAALRELGLPASLHSRPH